MGDRTLLAYHPVIEERRFFSPAILPKHRSGVMIEGAIILPVVERHRLNLS